MLVKRFANNLLQLIATCLLLPSITNAQKILTSLAEYDDLRSNSNGTINRVGNVDVISDANGDTIGLCNMAMMMPFSFYPGPPPDTPRTPFPFMGVLEGSLAVALAIQHLNTGDGSVIPQVEGLNDNCNVRFTLELFDSEMSESKGVDQTIEILNRKPGDVDEKLPCVFLGNGRSAVTLPTSIITGLNGYPQFSPISTSTQLDDKSQHGLFGRHITSDDGTAIPAILFFRDVLKIDHLAIIHNNDGYGNAYARALQKAAGEYASDMSLRVIDIPFGGTAEDFEQAVSFVKSTQYRYIFAIVEGAKDFNPLMIEAYNQGIAGTGKHNWFYSDSLSPNAVPGQTYEPNSPLHLATIGVSMLRAMPGLPGSQTYDALLEKWQELNNEEDIEYFVANKHPKHEPDYIGQPMDDAFFQDLRLVAPFLYDSTIAVGLAACNISSISTEFFDGRTHYDQIVNTQFEGATGSIILDKETGTRTPSSALFELVNYVQAPGKDENGELSIVPSNSYLFQNGQWNELTPMIFNDGTSDIQPGLPEITLDRNYIGTGLRVAGLVMCGIVLALCIGLGAFTVYHRNTRTIKASQPIFLLLLIGGIFLMGLSIIPLSFDDEIASDKGCSIACMAVPWLLCTGFSMSFAALSSKLRRINKLFNSASMRRIKVEPKDVIRPLVVFLLLNFLLLSLWTGLSPLIWTREVSSVDRFDRTISSVGYCTSEWYLPFVILLVVLNLSVLSYAMYQAYHARSISLEFSESEYITKALAACMLVCFIGVPVMVIVTDQPKAYFFVLASIIFILCSSLLLFIFVPKLLMHRNKNKAKLGTSIKSSMANMNYRTQESTTSMASMDSSVSDDGGVKIYDTPAMREEIKKKNETLTKENTRLTIRVAELEELLGKKDVAVEKDDDKPSVRFSDVTSESKEEDEEEGGGVSAV